MSSRCDLDLEDLEKKKFFPQTLRLMMLHHHTKFGDKMFSDSEIIVRTKSDTRTARQTNRQDAVSQID